MSEQIEKSKDVVKLDVETNVQTSEGRIFLKQLKQVSRVLYLKDSEVEFKGELLFKTGYIADCKGVMLYKCPDGFFLFLDKAFGKNNWSVIGKTLDEVLEKVSNTEIKKKIKEEASNLSKAA